jgi:PPOX class probable F420-dependent enzyme
MARLATLGRDGAPHLVPLCFVLDGEVVYWAVDHKPKRSTRLRRVDNLRADPRCSLLVDHYDEDWQPSPVSSRRPSPSGRGAPSAPASPASG